MPVFGDLTYALTRYRPETIWKKWCGSCMNAEELVLLLGAAKTRAKTEISGLKLIENMKSDYFCCKGWRGVSEFFKSGPRILYFIVFP